MNILEQWIEFNEEDPIRIMNVLQSCGIVSDNAVTPGELSDSDAEAAVGFLEG